MYALIPFFIKYIGVDIRPFCIELQEKNVWDRKKMRDALYGYPLEGYPSYDSTHSSSIRDYENYYIARPFCLMIRKRLIDHGLKPVEKIEIIDTGEWIIFDK